MAKTFEIDGMTHYKGAKQCSQCWDDSYPRDCQCGGRIHAEFGDENWDGDYWLFIVCDRCGDEHDEVDDAKS